MDDHRLMGRSVVDVEMINTWVNAELTFRSSPRCLHSRLWLAIANAGRANS